MDLVVVAADNNIRAAIGALLLRHERIQIRPIQFDAYAHIHKDPGVFTTAQEFLRQFQRSHQYALAIFDRDGCGSDLSAHLIRERVQQNLDVNGWRNRSCVSVLDPEIETWIWSPSQHVATALGWRDFRTLQRWLIQQQFLGEGEVKPARPKEAMEAALRQAKLPRSSAIYAKIASKVEFESCVDTTFRDLLTALRSWFPRTAL